MSCLPLGTNNMGGKAALNKPITVCSSTHLKGRCRTNVRTLTVSESASRSHK
jgi:hypothetical protein